MSGTRSSLNHAQKGNFAQGGLFDGGFTVVNDRMESWAKEGNQERNGGMLFKTFGCSNRWFLKINMESKQDFIFPSFIEL